MSVMLAARGCGQPINSRRILEDRRAADPSKEGTTLYLFNSCPRDCYDTCSMIARVRAEKLHSVEANAKHPFTGRNLCPKGRSMPQYVYSKNRLLHPVKRIGKKGEGQFERISWPDALKEISKEIRNRSAEFGTHSILQFGHAGNMGLIQRNFPNRFFNAIGAAKVTETICSNAGDRALELVYGSSLGMLPDEIQKCRLVVVWGMNPAWSSPHGFDIIKKAKKAGAKIYVIDPIQTATAEAGVHLQIRPTTDAVLALGSINHLIENRLVNSEFLRLNTVGFEKLTEVVKKFDMRSISRITGLGIGEIEDFIGDYTSMRPSCIMMGYGMQRNRNGGDMIRAISLLPAMIGEKRGFYYSNDLADFDMDYLRGTSLKSRIREEHGMVDLGRTLASGKAKMLFVYGSNPLATLPNQRLVRKEFLREDLFVVVHDLFVTDTADYADIVLPATTFFEHFDINTSYFHQYLSLNEKAIQPLGESKCNSDMFRALAAEMRLSHRELFEGDEKIARTLISNSRAVEGTYDTLTKKGFLRFKVPDRTTYETPSGKIELYSSLAEEEGIGGLPIHVEVRGRFPYQVISPVHQLLCRSQYHDRRREVAPIVYMNPRDAANEGIEPESQITLRNEFGELQAKAELSEKVPEGVLLCYSALWPKLSGGTNVNFVTTDYVQRYDQCSALNSTFVEIL
ncbi:MAG: molybdopterin-dependent oxidoreductase [Methanobacteriota archaeon]|nr:MAG: molybdopterin-dependent oxidoreductase [Euryarchaeota archaeon]